MYLDTLRALEAIRNFAVLFDIRKVINTIFAEHPSNKGKNKVTEKKKKEWHGNILNTAKITYRDSALKLTPQEKIDFEVAHILLKNDRFTSVQNNVTRVLSL